MKLAIIHFPPGVRADAIRGMGKKESMPKLDRWKTTPAKAKEAGYTKHDSILASEGQDFAYFTVPSFRLENKKDSTGKAQRLHVLRPYL